MSKRQKKRNKAYTGADAALPPTVRRYQAVVRSPLGEWWHDHKKPVKIGAGVGGVTLVIGYLIYELFRAIF